MRLALPAVLLALLPTCGVAAAEGAHLQALGVDLWWDHGVVGFQWDHEGAFGVRYWFNETRGDSASFVLTTCVTTDSHSVDECRRTRLLT